MRESRFSISKKDIVEYFIGLNKVIFNYHDIRNILGEYRKSWRLRGNYTVLKFIDDLLKYTDLKKHTLTDSNGDKLYRYSWGVVSVEDIALSIVKDGYFSHYTAVFKHGLTEQVPKTYHVNHELSFKDHININLTQEQIDKAFSKLARVSEQIYLYKDTQIIVLNSKNTEHLGVMNKPGPTPSGYYDSLYVTNIERTLIDISVSPHYAGGTPEVLKAFKNAAADVSINKLVAMLKKLDYIYPIHQRIGFYMDMACNYSESQLSLVRKIPINYDFYLSHGIEDKQYSKTWRLYYPKGLQ